MKLSFGIRSRNDIGHRDWFAVLRGGWGYWACGPVEMFKWPGYMRSYWVYGIALTLLGRRVAIIARTGQEA